jgi:hypothetical protein
VVRRQKPAHYQEYCLDICRGCVQCFTSSVLFIIADLIACRLNLFMTAVSCRRVIPRL